MSHNHLGLRALRRVMHGCGRLLLIENRRAAMMQALNGLSETHRLGFDLTMDSLAGNSASSTWRLTRYERRSDHPRSRQRRSTRKPMCFLSLDTS
jgi:hypothetical protein